MVSIPRVNKIIQNDQYNMYIEKNRIAEEERIYCRHGADHGLDVARIAYIYLLEENKSPIAKELVYAAGLLHDIGRWVEYETKEDHALVSARLAEPILRVCDFEESEIEIIKTAISEHRLEFDKAKSTLGQALILADDWARDCKNCQSKSSCYKYTKSMEEIFY